MVDNIYIFILGFFVIFLRAVTLYLLLPTLMYKDSRIQKMKHNIGHIFLLVVFYYVTFYGFIEDHKVVVILWIFFFSYYYYLMYFFTDDFATTLLVYSMVSILTYPLTSVIAQIAFNYFSFINENNFTIICDFMYAIQYFVLTKIFLTERGISFRHYLGNLFRKFSVLLYLYVGFEASMILVVNWNSPGRIVSVDMYSFIWFPVVIVLLLTAMIYQMSYFITLTLHLENQVWMQKYYVSSIEELYEDIRRYKHDMNNILLPLGFHIERKDYVGLEKYYKENIMSYKSLDVELYNALAHLTSLKMPELKGLILSKYQWSKQNNVKFSIWINDDIDSLDIDIVDTCRVMGILIDNSIEGAMAMDEGYVLFSMTKEGETVILDITNNYDHRTIPSKMMKRSSLKGEGRGIGLLSLKQVLKKYSNLKLMTSIKQDVYQQQLIFKKITADDKRKIQRKHE